jgi:hypothetical protein
MTVLSLELDKAMQPRINELIQQKVRLSTFLFTLIKEFSLTTEQAIELDKHYNPLLADETKQQKKYRELQKFLRNLYIAHSVEPGDMDEMINKIPELLGMPTDANGHISRNAKYPEL